MKFESNHALYTIFERKFQEGRDVSKRPIRSTFNEMESRLHLKDGNAENSLTRVTRCLATGKEGKR